MKRRYRGETTKKLYPCQLESLMCWPNVKTFTYNAKQTSIKVCGIVQDPGELQFTIHGFE